MTETLLLQRAQALKLYGLIAHWNEVEVSDWITKIIDWEEAERSNRGLQRRIIKAHLGRFKPLIDFDWQWPKNATAWPLKIYSNSILLKKTPISSYAALTVLARQL